MIQIRYISLVYTIIFIGTIRAQIVPECFIAQHNGIIIAAYGDITTQYSPCSTFKIALSLMGFDIYDIFRITLSFHRHINQKIILRWTLW